MSDIGVRGTPYQFNKNQEVTFRSNISVPNGSINTGGQVYAVGNVNGKNVYAKESMQASTITATTSMTAPKFIGDAQGVTGIAGTKNVARHVWFSDGDYETRRDYNDDFRYNPATNTLAVGTITLSNDPTADTDATNKAYVDALGKLYLHSLSFNVSEGDTYFEGTINIFSRTTDSVSDIYSISQKLGTVSSTMISGFLSTSIGIIKATRFRCETDGSILYIDGYEDDGTVYSSQFSSINIGEENVVEIL